MQSFAITVRKNGSYRVVTKDRGDYDEYFKHLETYNKKCVLVSHMFEQNKSEAGYHMHGVIDIPINYFRKKLMHPNYHLCLRPITDAAGWKRYMMKDVQLVTRDILKSMNRKPNQAEIYVYPDMDREEPYYGNVCMFDV